MPGRMRLDSLPLEFRIAKVPGRHTEFVSHDAASFLSWSGWGDAVRPRAVSLGLPRSDQVGVHADPAEFERNPAAYDIPDSVIGFLHGELGVPPGGWPEPFRTKALSGRPAATPVAVNGAAPAAEPGPSPVAD